MPIPPLTYKNWTEKSWKENKKKGRTQAKSPWQRNNKKTNTFKSKLIKFFAIVFAGLIFFGFVYVFRITRDLPDPNHLMNRQIAQSTIIYDRTGKNILYEISGDQKRTLVSINDIPNYVKWATISVEDKDFYHHGAFSLWAIFRTAVTDVLFGRSAGGSTLTQQFVKNAVLSDQKTFTRKIKEIVIAYQLEKKFSKDQILQMYFNEIPYGSTAYGVEAASELYFGKSVKDVTLPEAAILAALPQAPSYYSPYGTHKDALIARQRYVLDLMAKYGYITQAQADQAKNTPLKFKPLTNNITAPHFVMYVKELLEEQYGEKEVEEGGLKIYTTLDLYKQQAAENAVTAYAAKNEKYYNASNAALVSIDPKTGQILAMVGSRDYFNDKIDGQVNVATSQRQPGSSIKPIVYATAFTKGYSPNTVLYDVSTNFSTDSTKPYIPNDFSAKEYGPVTMRQALDGSLNIPAVKTLYLAGLNNVIDLAQALGYTTFDDINRFGLSFALGGGEVTLLEHTNAYSAFAREGIIHTPTAILKVVDKNGNVLQQYQDQPRNVLDPNVARMVNDVLSDDSARAYVFGAHGYLTLGDRPVAAKTGTTNDFRDAWTVGYTPSIVTGVWVGNSDNRPMRMGADGVVVAAPIWNKYMKTVLGDTPIEQFKKPDIQKTGKPVLDGNTTGQITVNLDKSSGLLAATATPADFVEQKTYQEDHCILYWVNKDDPLGPAPADPTTDPQFNLWEGAVQAWAAKNHRASSTPPTATDNVHIPANQPTLTILSPVDKQILTNPDLSVSIQASAPRGISRADYYIDNNLVYTNTNYPFNFEKNISFLRNGFHNLTVKVSDDVDNSASQSLDFNLLLPNQVAVSDVGIYLNAPANTSVSTSSFPVLFSASLSNEPQIASVSFYYASLGSDNYTMFSNLAPIQSNAAETTWIIPPPPGNYKIYAQANGWNGQSAKSNEIDMTVK